MLIFSQKNNAKQNQKIAGLDTFMRKPLSKKNIWEALPTGVKSLASIVVQYIPLELLLGADYRRTRELIRRSEYWTHDEIADYQFRKLKVLLALAYDRSSFYRDAFDKVGFHPDAFQVLEDFQKLPFIDKSDILGAGENMQTRPLKGARVDYITTGGTSGVPLGFYINVDRSGVEYAYLTEGWRRIGFTLKDIKAVLRGKVVKGDSGLHHSFDATLKEHYYSNFHMSEAEMGRYLSHMATLPPFYLHAYPSSAYMLARYAARSGSSLGLNLKGIITESENVYPDQRSFIEQVFGERCFSSYGHTEKLIAATECEHNYDYHIWPTYGYFELVDDAGQVVTEKGKTGQIVGTGFINTFMPFIRYKTGDFAEYVGSSCDECGRNHPIIKNIRGHRIQEHLVAADGSMISLTAINMHDDTFNNVLQYQFRQTKPGFAELKVVAKNNFNQSDQDRIQKNIGEKLTGVINLTVIQVPEIKLTPRGKSIYVDQQIPPPMLAAPE